MVTSSRTMLQSPHLETDLGRICSSPADVTSFMCSHCVYVCKYTSTQFYHTCRFMEPPPQSGYRTFHYHQDPSCYPFMITAIFSLFPWALATTNLYSYHLITSKVLIHGNIHYTTFRNRLFSLIIMSSRSPQAAMHTHHCLVLFTVELYSIVRTSYSLCNRVPVEGHLGCSDLQLIQINTNKAALNMDI